MALYVSDPRHHPTPAPGRDRLHIAIREIVERMTGHQQRHWRRQSLMPRDADEQDPVDPAKTGKPGHPPEHGHRMFAFMPTPVQLPRLQARQR